MEHRMLGRLRWAWRLKGGQSPRETDSCSQEICSLSFLWGGLLFLRWSGLGMVCVLCNQKWSPGSHGCHISAQFSAEVVSTSPRGAEIGLRTSKHTPEEMCLSSMLGAQLFPGAQARMKRSVCLALCYIPCPKQLAR